MLPPPRGGGGVACAPAPEASANCPSSAVVVSGMGRIPSVSLAGCVTVRGGSGRIPSPDTEGLWSSTKCFCCARLSFACETAIFRRDSGITCVSGKASSRYFFSEYASAVPLGVASLWHGAPLLLWLCLIPSSGRKSPSCLVALHILLFVILDFPCQPPLLQLSALPCFVITACSLCRMTLFAGFHMQTLHRGHHAEYQVLLCPDYLGPF